MEVHGPLLSAAAEVSSGPTSVSSTPVLLQPTHRGHKCPFPTVPLSFPSSPAYVWLGDLRMFSLCLTQGICLFVLSLPLIAPFLAFGSPLLPSNMFLSEILLITCSRYLNEQLESKSINVFLVLFLLVVKQHELCLCTMMSCTVFLHTLGLYRGEKHSKAQESFQA